MRLMSEGKICLESVGKYKHIYLTRVLNDIRNVKRGHRFVFLNLNFVKLTGFNKKLCLHTVSGGGTHFPKTMPLH